MVKRSGGALLPTLRIDRAADRPIGLQLTAALRELILSGQLPAGERLPATRTVARDLSVSRTVVVETFERLAGEGLIECRTGAGSFVSEALLGQPPALRLPADPAKPLPRLARRIAGRSEAMLERPGHMPRAFTTAMPAFDAFPVALWSRCVAKHWRQRRDAVLGYGDPSGFMPLRRAIAAHLGANRGISCAAEEVFVVNGAQHGFQLLSMMLLEPGDSVWFENPGAIGARNCFATAGARLVPVPVDAEGLVVEEGLRRAPDFRLAFVTPSHQQPLGSTMSLARRFALLAAAEAAQAWIVEDDYDGEFTYAGSPLPTLRSIDAPGRVIYVGTFSKTLFPSLRLGYVLAPPHLVEALEKFVRAYSCGAPSNSQAVLADFIEEGHFAAHIRRMRKLYAERHQALQDSAARHLSGLLGVAPTKTGLHTIGSLPVGAAEAEISRRAFTHGVSVSPIGRYCIAPVEARGLVLGFSGVDPREIDHGAAVLSRVLAEAPRPGA